MKTQKVKNQICSLRSRGFDSLSVLRCRGALVVPDAYVGSVDHFLAEDMHIVSFFVDWLE